MKTPIQKNNPPVIAEKNQNISLGNKYHPIICNIEWLEKNPSPLFDIVLGVEQLIRAIKNKR